MKHLKLFVFLCFLTFTISCGQQKKFIQYKVKEGETIRTIAKKLDMSTRDLLRLNPEVGRKPDANTLILIPNKKSTITKVGSNSEQYDETNTTNRLQDSLRANLSFLEQKDLQKKELIEALEKEFKIHEVKKGDTFYSLTRFYNVSREELTVLNPELLAGLKLGQIIKIMPLKDIVEETAFLYTDFIEENIQIKAAILLPFRALDLDTLSDKDIFTNSRLANIVTDFYLGAEIAIDSLKKQGVNIQLDVFDTGKNSTKIKQLVLEEDFNEKDVVIGPLYFEEAQFLAEKVDVPIVFPVFSKKQAAFTSHKIITTVPNKNLFREELIKYIEETFSEGNVIVVGDGSYASNLHSQKVQEVLRTKDSMGTVSLITSTEGYIKKEEFIDVLKPNEKNTVVLTTDDPIIVQSAINSCISLPEEVTVRVFAFDKDSFYNKVDNKILANIGFTYVTNEYTREDSFKVIEFNRKYEANNGVLPSYYATKGFDIAYDVLMRLASGNSLKDSFKEGVSYRVESKFDYTENLTDVTENKGLFILKYNADLTLTRIK